MAKLVEVTWAGAAKSGIVDLEGLDIVGFWDKDDALSGTGLTITTVDSSAGTDESDPVVDWEDATTAITIDLDAGSHNFVLIPAWRLSGLMRWVYLTSSGAETGTAYLVVRDLR